MLIFFSRNKYIPHGLKQFVFGFTGMPICKKQFFFFSLNYSVPEENISGKHQA